MPTKEWDVDVPPPVVVNAGFRITSGDVGAVNGVRITYRVGGKTTHKDFRIFVIACVKPNPCDAPDGEEDYEDVVLREFGLMAGE